MSDWFATTMDPQREMIRAQRTHLDAAGKMLEGGRQLTAMQEAGQKAAEANMAAWKQWAGMWGWK